MTPPDARPSTDGDRRASYDRRASDRPSDAVYGKWHRTILKAGDYGRLIPYLAIVGAILAALGFRFTSVSQLADRVTRVEQQQALDGYLLCILARHSVPDATPTDCAPIIERGGKRPADMGQP